MPKFLAPPSFASMTLDNVEYTPDEDGFVIVDHPDHQTHALMHGLVLVTKEMEDNGVGRSVFGHFVEGEQLNFEGFVPSEVVEAKDARIAELEALLAEKGVSVPPADPAATVVASTGSDALGDTSSAAGGGTVGDHLRTGDSEDKVGPALAKEPKFDDMDRDQLVEWLHGVGVMIPGNVSKDAARKAVDEVVAEHNAKQKA